MGVRSHVVDEIPGKVAFVRKSLLVPLVLAIGSFPWWYHVAPPPPFWDLAPDPVVSLTAGAGTQEVSEVALRWRELESKRAELQTKLESAQKELAKAEAQLYQPSLRSPASPSSGSLSDAQTQESPRTGDAGAGKPEESERHQRMLDRWKASRLTYPYSMEGSKTASAMVREARKRATPLVLQRGSHWMATGEAVLSLLAYQRGVLREERPLLTSYQQHHDFLVQLEAVHPEVSVGQWVQWVSEPYCSARNFAQPGTEQWILSLVTRSNAVSLVMDYIGAESMTFRIAEIPPEVRGLVVPRHRNFTEDSIGLPSIAYGAIDQFLFYGNLDSAVLLYDVLGDYVRAHPRAIASQYVVWGLQLRHGERLAERLTRHGVPAEDVARWTSPQSIEVRFQADADGKKPAGAAYKSTDSYGEMIYASFTYPTP